MLHPVLLEAEALYHKGERQRRLAPAQLTGAARSARERAIQRRRRDWSKAAPDTTVAKPGCTCSRLLSVWCRSAIL